MSGSRPAKMCGAVTMCLTITGASQTTQSTDYRVMCFSKEPKIQSDLLIWQRAKLIRIVTIGINLNETWFKNSRTKAK